MKRIIVLLIIAVISLSLTACGNNLKANKDEKDNTEITTPNKSEQEYIDFSETSSVITMPADSTFDDTTYNNKK